MNKRFLPWFILLAVPLLTCSRENEPGPSSLQTYTQTIGAAGGSLTADGLTFLDIPPEAIGSSMEFSATPLADAEAFYLLDEQQLTGFLGGVEFGPEGTEFAKPVSITLPLNVNLVAGSKMALYYFDRHEGAWIESRVMGTVSSDGRSISAEVMHFTPWGIFDLPEDARIMSQFMEYFGIGDDPIGALNNYVNWINDVIKPLDFRGLIRNCCYAIRGYQVEVVYKVNGVENVMERTVGEQMPDDYPSFWFQYQDVLNIPAYDIHVLINLRLYLGCKPDLYLTSDKKKLRTGEKAKLSACLVCGDKPMSGASIGISNQGEGKLDTDMVKTNQSGKGEFTLTGDETGIARIHASYEACKCEISTEEYTAGYNIPIGNSETWTGQLELIAGGCNNQMCIERFEISVNFENSLVYESDGHLISTFNILDSSIFVNGLEISENVYDGYIDNIRDAGLTMIGKIVRSDELLVFDFWVNGSVSFDYYASPMEGLALFPYLENRCWLRDLGDVVPLPENGQLVHSASVILDCITEVEGTQTYTLKMQRVD